MARLPRSLQEAGVTGREAEVLDALTQHLANPEIAQRLFVSKRTVESHVASLLRKLKVTTRAALIEIGLSAGVGGGSELPPALRLASVAAGPFVGRGAELALADELLEGGRERVALLWLLGEPGIGKTRLAVEIARRAHRDGAVVLHGHCDEDLRVPYQPFLEALAGFADHTDRDASRFGNFPDDLLTVVGPGPRRLPQSEVQQWAFFEAVRSWLDAAGMGRPVLLVIDDAQWATSPTVALLAHVARSAAPSRAVIVCTARDTVPDDSEPLARLVEELDRRGAGSYRLRLCGLDLAAVGDLVEQAGGDVATLAADLHHQTAGNPLFISTLLDTLHEGVRPRELPRSVAETVQRRMSALPIDVDLALRTAAVIGVDFGVALVARVAGRAELAIIEALETAQRAGLVRETGPDSYRFVHALVRSALRAASSDSRRVRVHLRVGEAMEVLCAARDQPDALARHFSEAVPVGGGPKAYRYTVLAAERAAGLLSHEEAADAYRRALGLLEHAGADACTRHDLLFARGDAQRRAGRFLDAVATLQAAAEEAALRGSGEALARAAVTLEETSFWLGVSGHHALTYLERAAEALPPGPSAARALTAAAASRALEFAGKHEQSLSRREEALALAEQTGDPQLMVKVLVRTTMAYQRVAEAAEGAAVWAEVRRRAGDIGDDVALNHALTMSLWAAAQQADFGSFDDLFAQHEDLTTKLRLGGWELFLDSLRSFRAFAAGDLEIAELMLERAQDAGRSLGFAREGLYGVAMFLIRREQGRLHEVLPAARALAAFSGASLWGPGVAALYAELGMVTEARREFEALAAAGFSDLPEDGSRDLFVGLLAEVCASVGDAERAPLLIEHLADCEGRLVIPAGGAACLGPADRLLALLASTAGRDGDAQRWFRRALQLSERIGSPLWTARCQYDHACHLLRSDPDEAGAMLSEATRYSRDHDLVGVERLIERTRRCLATGARQGRL